MNVLIRICEDAWKNLKTLINFNSMINDPVQIIYLNGPSSSGKTTLAKAIQHSFETLFLLVGIDKIIGWMPEKVNDWTGGEASLGYSWKKSTDESGNHLQELQIGPYAVKIAKTFQEIVLMLAKQGHHLIIDDVSFGKKQVDEWKELLKPFKVLWIGVNAPRFDSSSGQIFAENLRQKRSHLRGFCL